MTHGEAHLIHEMFQRGICRPGEYYNAPEGEKKFMRQSMMIQLEKEVQAYQGQRG